jgi:hypothetical protein
MVNLRNGDIESASEPAEQTFDDAPLFFERIYPMQMQLRCQYANYHNFIV